MNEQNDQIIFVSLLVISNIFVCCYRPDNFIRGNDIMANVTVGIVSQIFLCCYLAVNVISLGLAQITHIKWCMSRNDHGIKTHEIETRIILTLSRVCCNLGLTLISIIRAHLLIDIFPSEGIHCLSSIGCVSWNFNFVDSSNFV